jgi:hypothetical protein
MAEYFQLNPLSCCVTCTGCNLEEIETFTGVLKCKNYMQGCKKGRNTGNIEEQIKRMDKERQQAIKENENEIIDIYWKGD